MPMLNGHAVGRGQSLDSDDRVFLTMAPNGCQELECKNE